MPAAPFVAIPTDRLTPQQKRALTRRCRTIQRLYECSGLLDAYEWFLEGVLRYRLYEIMQHAIHEWEARPQAERQLIEDRARGRPNTHPADELWRARYLEAGAEEERTPCIIIRHRRRYVAERRRQASRASDALTATEKWLLREMIVRAQQQECAE